MYFSILIFVMCPNFLVYAALMVLFSLHLSIIYVSLLLFVADLTKVQTKEQASTYLLSTCYRLLSPVLLNKNRMAR